MPRVVFLHGFPLDGRMWDGQRHAFGVPTCAPTLYRRGPSMAAWAASVLTEVADETLVAVGSSLGGFCALEMARQAGDRIAAIVLVGSKCEHRPEPDLRDRDIAGLRKGGNRYAWSEMSASFFGPSSDPAVIAGAEAIALEQSTDDLVRAMEIFHGRADATDVANAWQKPFLVIRGEEDRCASPRKMAAAAASAPFGRLQIMLGCGHFPNLDRPAEFNALLAEFIRPAN